MKKTKANRVTQQDMSDAMFHPTKGQPAAVQTAKTLVFTVIGQHQETVDELGNVVKDGYPLLTDLCGKNGKVTPAEELSAAYAKSVKRGSKVKYYIKRGGDGRLYNPLGLYNETLSMSSKNASNSNVVRDGRKLYRFDEVNQKTFMSYLMFLKTRNQAWLTTCQREII